MQPGIPCSADAKSESPALGGAFCSVSQTPGHWTHSSSIYNSVCGVRIAIVGAGSASPSSTPARAAIIRSRGWSGWFWRGSEILTGQGRKGGGEAWFAATTTGF